MWARVHSGERQWSPGIIIEKLGPRNYKVQIGQNISKHHVDQLRYRFVEDPGNTASEDFDNLLSPPDHQPASIETSSRYPSGIQNPPDRLTY